MLRVQYMPLAVKGMVYVKKIFYWVLTVIMLTMCISYAQTIIPPEGGVSGHLSEYLIWITQDANGFDHIFVGLAGQFNLASRVSTPEGRNFDDAYSDAFSMGLSFAGINDSSSLMSFRTFTLMKGVSLKKADTLKVPIIGYRWIGDVSVTVVGSDVLFKPSSPPPIEEPHDYLTDFSSEYQYTNILKNGAYFIKNAKSIDTITSAIDGYINFWTKETSPPMDFNIKYAEGTQIHKALREDLDYRLNSASLNSELSQYVDMFTFFKIQLQAQASVNPYVSAIFCLPLPSQEEYKREEFFEERYDPTIEEVFSMIEVKNLGQNFDYTRLCNALKAGWKVAPVTTAGGEVLKEDNIRGFTGVWVEIPEEGTETPMEAMQRTLEAFRKRRVFVSNLPKGSIRLYIRDKQGMMVGIMGDEISGDIPMEIRVNIGREKEVKDFYYLDPKLVVVYKDGSVRFFPFKALYRDVDKSISSADREYQMEVANLIQAQAIFAVCDVVKVEESEINPSWSRYKTLKMLQRGVFKKVRYYQMVSAPIYIR